MSSPTRSAAHAKPRTFLKVIRLCSLTKRALDRSQSDRPVAPVVSPQHHLTEIEASVVLFSVGGARYRELPVAQMCLDADSRSVTPQRRAARGGWDQRPSRRVLLGRRTRSVRCVAEQLCLLVAPGTQGPIPLSTCWTRSDSMALRQSRSRTVDSSGNWSQ